MQHVHMKVNGFTGAIIEVSNETDDVDVSFMKQDKLSFV